MNPNNKTIIDNEIDLKEIVLTLWKEKYLIIIFTLTFAVAGYIYGTLKPTVYQSTISLRDAPSSIFNKSDLFISQTQQSTEKISVALNYTNEFKLNLITLDNLIKFFEQNKELDEFKSYLKKNNIKTATYFQGKFQAVYGNKGNFLNKYTLIFSSPLPGEKFLNDYIVFTKQVTVVEFKERLKESIKNEIKVYDQNLEIAKSINLENPILKSFAEGNSVVNEPIALFYKGSKVLSLQKSYLEKFLEEIDNFTLNYNPILEQASNPIILTKSPSIYMVIAFALGLFISFVVIFIRFIKQMI